MSYENDSNNNSNELKELLLEFQSLFGALEIDEDTTAIDIIDEDLITSGITDSLRLAHQSNKQNNKRSRTRTMPKKHIRDDESSKEQGPSSKRLCCQGRSGIREDMKLNQNHPRLVVKIHYQITAENNPVLYNRLTIKRIGN